jgi:hypothetical protein
LGRKVLKLEDGVRNVGDRASKLDARILKVGERGPPAYVRGTE